jgi:predicted ATP-grasp superfamily ATP-dependent carboligase
LITIFVYEWLSGGGMEPSVADTVTLPDLGMLLHEGRTMRDALVADLAALPEVGVTYASCRFESGRPAGTHCMPVVGEDFSDFVGRISRVHDFTWLIAPECDGLLLRLHDVVGPARWLGCARAAIEVASSKRATAATLAAHGIRTTLALDPDRLPQACAAASSGTCWVVKPDDGAGGLETIVYTDAAVARSDYLARCRAGGKPVLQQWVEGEALSLALLCGPLGAELLSINRQRIGLDGEPDAPRRKVQVDGVELNRIGLQGAQGRTLAALAGRIASALPGLHGIAGVDLVWHPDHGPVVIEVNPRLTSAYVGMSASLGRNVARDALRACGVLHDDAALAREVH